MQMRGGARVLCVDMGEHSQEVARGFRRAFPVARRALRDARIDQSHGNARGVSARQHLWPKLAFHEDRRRWAPMGQKPVNRTTRIKRGKLMGGARWQAGGQHLCRTGRARGDQEGPAGICLAHTGDQAQHRHAFPDRGGLKPDQRAVGAVGRGPAHSFSQSRGIGALCCQLILDARIDQRRDQVCRRAVKSERQRRGGAVHQPPVWLMWRDTRPSTLWRE